MSGVHVQGLDQLYAFLRQFPDKVQTNMLGKCIGKAGAVMKQAVKDELTANGSVDSGLLRNGIRYRTKKKKGMATATVYASGKHSHIALWLEYGVKRHGLKKGARRAKNKYQHAPWHPGFSAKPFFRPAIDKSGKDAAMAFALELRKQIEGMGNSAAASVDLEAEA